MSELTFNDIEELQNKEATAKFFNLSDYEDSMKHTFIHGKKRGETTHTPIDPLFTWKKTFVHCWTGFANMGKTEFLFWLCLLKSIRSGWKWLVFVPENMGNDAKGEVSPDEFYDTLIHTYVGKTPDPIYKGNQMSMLEYEKAMEFISEHFLVVYPDIRSSPQDMLNIMQEKVGDFDGVVLDPWNRMHHAYGGLIDDYLAEQFDLIKRFAVKNNIVFNIVAHPKRVDRKQTEELKPADQFSIRGGEMWGNGMDCILSMHRPNWINDRSDTTCEFWTQKIKNQKLVGSLGSVQMNFDYRKNRYTFNGTDPYESNFVQMEAVEDSRNRYEAEEKIPF